MGLVVILALVRLPTNQMHYSLGHIYSNSVRIMLVLHVQCQVLSHSSTDWEH